MMRARPAIKTAVGAGVSGPRIFISAGEASGDAYGAALVKLIGDRLPEARFEAVGGRRLESLGVLLVADSSDWGAMGIFEAVKVGPKVMGGFRKAVKALKLGRPGLFIPIDFGFINIKLARIAKRQGWKVLYFIPPGSWRKTKQGSDLPGITDAIVTPFPWSAEILAAMGANAYFFGHPLKQMIRETAEKWGQSEEDRKTIAILPGSRLHEVKYNLPQIAEAVRDLGMTVEFAVASNLRHEDLRDEWEQLVPGVDSIFTPLFTYRVLSQAKAAIVCSGTATLEAALCRCPCVVVYRGSRMMELEYKIRKPKFDYISLPNILLGRGVLKELLQHDASAQAIHAELVSLIEPGARRSEQLAAFSELDAMLGPDNAIDQTVELAVKLLAQLSS